jgi:hypothetical protein
MHHRSLTIAFCSLLSLTACSAGSSIPRAGAGGYPHARGEASGSDGVRSASVSAEVTSEFEAPTSVPTPSASAPRAPSASSARAPMAMGAATPARAAHGTPVRTTAVAPGTAEGSSASVQQAPANVLLIYNAQVIAQVDHVPSGIDQVIEAASAVGGFLASRTDSSVTVRVPAARFREALGRVEALATVTSRNVQAEDVTEAFHDLEVRLQNLRSVQARLQQFLSRASNVSEALAVERELERVGQQIDEVEGRMRFLANRAAFSTITVTLTARPRENALPPRPSTPSYEPIPESSLPFELLEQLGLARLLMAR